MDGRRLKARLYKYRLASDGVLVARPDDDNPSVDRPVVPDSPYEYGNDRAPSTMTWKHLLLGAVHNTITGLHKKAADMTSDLDRLVAWWPPKSLRPDCKNGLSDADCAPLCTGTNAKNPCTNLSSNAKRLYDYGLTLLRLNPRGKTENGISLPLLT